MKLAPHSTAFFLLPLLLLMLSPWATATAQQNGDDLEERARLEAMDAAEQHYRMAVQFYGQGRYREAVQEFDRALALHDDPVVHCNRAVPLVRLEEFREAFYSMRNCRDGFSPESEDYAHIDAQAEALRVFVEHVRPQSVEVARDIAAGPPPERSVYLPVDPPAVEPPARIGGLGVTGILLLSTGLGLGVAAAVVDIRSAPLVTEFREQSLGGPNSSGERHGELRTEIEQNQRLFFTLAAASLGSAVIGGGLLGTDLYRRRSPEEGPYLSVGPAGIEAGMRLRF